MWTSHELCEHLFPSLQSDAIGGAGRQKEIRTERRKEGKNEVEKFQESPGDRGGKLCFRGMEGGGGRVKENMAS